MRTTRTIAAALIVFLLQSPAHAQDKPVKGKIVGVDLFKNGLAVIRCEVVLGKPGSYVLDEVPQPIHGTYWVESTGPIESLVRMRDVDVSANETPPGNLQDDLAGKKVIVSIKGDKRPPLTGTVVKYTLPKDQVDGATPARYLVLQTGKGRAFIDHAEIASVEVEEAADTVKRTRPQLVLTLGESEMAENRDTRVMIRYLTRGLSWAPSYRLDITDPKTLTLEQHAIIRNELVNLDGAEIRLISGFPSVQFSHVLSPLSPRMSWAMFFAQLGHSGGRDNDYASNGIAMQNSAGNYRQPTFDLSLGAIPTGEGVDLHYQPIGKRSLAKDDTLGITVAGGKADYERVVEWVVPDNRDAYGSYSGRGHTDEDEPWDALKFKNPLTFPMTTGPATVTANGQFNGQRSTYWVNAGEETVMRVNKALSVRTRAIENEVLPKGGGNGDFIWVGGRQFRKSTVSGELSVSNHRKENTQVLIRRRFSGELVSAEGAPKSSLREEGVFSINKRNELLWAVALKAGEERTLKYSYTVLVPH